MNNIEYPPIIIKSEHKHVFYYIEEYDHGGDEEFDNLRTELLSKFFKNKKIELEKETYTLMHLLTHNY